MAAEIPVLGRGDLMLHLAAAQVEDSREAARPARKGNAGAGIRTVREAVAALRQRQGVAQRTVRAEGGKPEALRRAIGIDEDALRRRVGERQPWQQQATDRKSTRLNSSH